MKRTTVLVVVAAFCLVGMAALSLPDTARHPTQTAAPRQPTPGRGAVLRVGVLSAQPNEARARLKAVLSTLARQLAGEGIGRAELVPAGSMGEMLRLVDARRVDLFVGSAIPAALLAASGGMKPILKQTFFERGVIFVHKDSSIESPKDLEGRVLGFENEYSTAGHLLPQATLVKRGAKLQRLRSSRDPVGWQRIGYVFTRDNENTMLWVLKGKVDAGAMSRSAYRAAAGPRLHDLRIIQTTHEVPRGIVAHRREMPPDVVAAVKAAMLSLPDFSVLQEGEFAPIHALAELIAEDLDR